MAETKFRRYFRGLLLKSGVWTASVEHRSGGTAGMGDLWVQLGEGAIPVELKVGEYHSGTDKLHCSRLRPAQIGFLDGALRAGVAARLIIGDQEGGCWDAFMLRDVSVRRLAKWRKGFDMDELVLVARGPKLVLPVTQW